MKACVKVDTSKLIEELEKLNGVINENIYLKDVIRRIKFYGVINMEEEINNILLEE